MHVSNHYLEVLQPLLKVVVVGSDRPSEPVEGVLDVPLDDFARLGGRTSHFHQVLGSLAVLAQLLAGLAWNKKKVTKSINFAHFNGLEILSLNSNNFDRIFSTGIFTISV